MTAKTKDRVIIYTDGGCDPNPGVGGWGAVLTYKGVQRELSGGASRTTNNRMEMTAAIEALKSLKRPCSVVLHTDSEYLKKGITAWLPAWKRNGWQRKRGSLKNADLWMELDALTQVHEVTWEWVPAHTGIEANERCDELAAAEIQRRKAAHRIPSRRGRQE